ncbi:MAG: Fic family protein [Coriobacteriales bacterium]|nr:Fic family protein [Coriobacteriales bacterium]
MTDILNKTYKGIVAWWQDLGIATREDLSEALVDYRVRFAYHTGTIENPALTYHDTRDVFEDGRVRSFSGDPRTLFEIQNLKSCHELILDSFASKRQLDEELLLETHQTLTQGTYDERRWRLGERPGTYKVRDYVVGAGDVGAPPEEVRAEVLSLLDEVRIATASNALTVAAYFHAVLENIHPFADGNGRVGRELMNYLLVRFNHPPIIVFEEDRTAYYGAMEAWDSERDLNALCDFLKVETVRTWKKV